MSDSRQIAADLGKHAAEAMQEVLNRHMKVAMGVLEPADIMVVLLNIANGVAMGAAFYAMQVSNDDADPEALFDMTADALPKLLQAGRPAILAEFAKRGRAGGHG